MDSCRVKERLQDDITHRLSYEREQSDSEVLALIDEAILRQEELRYVPIQEKHKLRKEIFASMRGFDILQGLLEDETVTEIMINGPGKVFVERCGKVTREELQFSSEEKLMQVIQQMVAGCNRTVNEAFPIVDARLPGGARVNVVLHPISLDGPIVTIRRFPDKPITIAQLIENGAVSEEASDFMKLLVKAKYNIIISGGTGSGKTTFLNVLSGFLPPKERIITIEDSAELQLQGVDNLVRLETRSNNVEGCKEISMRDLIRCSLRMRPDRIIVGEVRGAEAAEMMTCLNTGHDGSMSTAHANSAKDMLERLETMISMGSDIPLPAIRRQIASGVDIIIQLGRMRDGSRKVIEILEILGYEEEQIQCNVLYQFEETECEEKKVCGRLVAKGRLQHVEKLKREGLYAMEKLD